MAIGEHKTTWAGQPILDWKAGQPIADPTGTAYRLAAEYVYRGESVVLTDVFARFLETPGSADVTGLVIGNWIADFNRVDSSSTVEMLAGAAPRLPSLRSLFFGDITFEENEISWIQQSDVSPLFAAFPRLEHFGVRGGNGLSLGQHRLPHLKTLVIETGGMNAALAEEALALETPSLEHLELWLGTEQYGASATMETLVPLLEAPERWPKLTYLGLRDSEIADEIAEGIVNAPILSRLSVLDLSLGTLSDIGARVLVDSPAIRNLKKLDIHHHYVSPEMVTRLQSFGIEVDASEEQLSEAEEEEDGEIFRYVAVGE